MKVNFSELLASERIRPLWGRSFSQETAAQDLQQILAGNAQAGGPSGSTSGNLPPAEAGTGQPAGSSSAAGRAGGAARHSSGDLSAGTSAPGGSAGSPAATAAATETGGSGAPSDTRGEGAFVPPPDLADLPVRPPHEIFAELERAVQGDLGTRATMVRNYIEALRVRVHSVDPTAGDALYHPMRHAAGGSIWELLNKMEDTLSGLRRVAAGR